MPANLELKARCGDLDAARERTKAVATAWLGLDEQVDTYFRTASSGMGSEATPSGVSGRQVQGETKPRGVIAGGRLKLRESALSGGQLVAYLRPDQPGARRSDYVVIPVPEPERTRALLTALLGVHRIVRKRREIALYQNVRVHLDRVEGLGDFVELEAVWDGAAAGEAEQVRRLAYLRGRLAIRDADLVAVSYEALLETPG